MRRRMIFAGGGKIQAIGLTCLAMFGLLIAPLPTACAQFTPFQQAIADFDAEVAAGVARDSAGCAMVTVFQGNQVIWSKGYGWADIENQRPATAETIGRVGSISKSFTAVVAVQLMERGLLKLDDPVEQVLPEIRQLVGYQDQPTAITLRMLANHTSGLIREPQLRGAAAGSIYHWEDKLLASIARTSFQYPPQQRFSYSNIGYGILGYASSRAAKVPFRQLVHDQIFAPLDMKSSAFVINTPSMQQRLAVGYSQSRNGDVSSAAADREHFGRGYKVPNGGIYATVGDLAKFAAAMMNASPTPILSERSLQQVFATQAPAMNYGLGFTVQPTDDAKIVGHGGSVAGYNANLIFDLKSQVGVAMLRTTQYNPPTHRLLQTLLDKKGDRSN